MNAWFEDLPYALRMMRKNRGLSVVIVASLALGVGANTAIFSVVDALLLRPLPYPQPERLVNVWLHSPALGIFRDWPSPGQYIDLQNENHSFDQMALAQSRTFTLMGREHPERINVMMVQSTLFQLLGAKPQLGRLFSADKDRPGKPGAAILTAAAWRRLFGSDPAMVGKSITINGNPVTVVGVLQPGFNWDHVITLQTAALGVKYDKRAAVDQFYLEVGNRIARLPGVTAEGAVSVLPLTGSVGWGQINVESYRPPPGQELQVDLRTATPDYFRAMEIPLLKGRFFAENDTVDRPPVAIIDQKFAQRFWPQGDAVGKHVWFDEKRPLEVVGVVGAVKQDGLGTDGKIAVYFPSRQMWGDTMFLVARTVSDPVALSTSIVREIRAVDPDIAVYGIQTMPDRVHHSLARERFASVMLSAFAVFALLLASPGVHGVMSYLVTQSTHDIGVRAALGARPGDILGLVLKQGMGLVAIGIVGGLAAAFAFTRAMDSLLFGVTATDAATFAAVIGLLTIAALAAAIVPARRAATLDPIVALREE